MAARGRDVLRGSRYGVGVARDQAAVSLFAAQAVGCSSRSERRRDGRARLHRGLIVLVGRIEVQEPSTVGGAQR
jgi:hypothetical protein